MSLTPKLLQQGAAGSARPVYIEDVFSAFLYTGDSSVRVITNGIDLSGKGGLVWTKSRSTSADHALVDTARGVNNILRTNTTDVQYNFTSIAQFNSNGYNLYDPIVGLFNNSGTTYVSWTFRKQRKFFDIVTWTGNGVSGRTISHNLGSAPGCIIVKRTDDVAPWAVYHRSLTYTDLTPTTFPAEQCWLSLNQTTSVTNSSMWGNTSPTSSVFSVGGGNYTNTAGGTYVAYLFAHNAGGFGLTGSDNVISCGSYTGTGATGNAITLGYEAQWVMVKRTDSTGDWEIMDAMRSGFLEPNTSDAESGGSWFSLSGDNFFPTATGFQINTAGLAWNASGGTYIYIAIRRGPMKVPTLGTNVFTPVTYTGDGSSLRTITTNIVTDMIIGGNRSSFSGPANDRLRGQVASYTTDNSAELSSSVFPTFDVMNGYINLANGGDFNSTGGSFIRWAFRRAPSFFDEVCYTGTGSATTQTHNLGVTPELMVVKNRSGVRNWFVWVSGFGVTDYLELNLTGAKATGANIWNSTLPTASVFSVNGVINTASNNFVAYLFATCAGVSKVGSYTGNGSSQTIDCGFAAGARFVLIKRTDATGDWYTFDTVRGIIAGNDPFLSLNATSAEVTSYDAVDPANSGFIVNNDATNFPINVASATYIFLAIA